jgi:hypothetical protein
MTNLGADTVAALDAGHNAKVRHGIAVASEGLEEVLGLMAEVAELGRDLSESEMVFARPENFLPSQVADALSKNVTAGIPLPMAVEDLGWSPQRVDRLRSEQAAQRTLAAAFSDQSP